MSNVTVIIIWLVLTLGDNPSSLLYVLSLLKQPSLKAGMTMAKWIKMYQRVKLESLTQNLVNLHKLDII